MITRITAACLLGWAGLWLRGSDDRRLAALLRRYADDLERS